MSKYEAVINLSVELDAKNAETADKQVYGEMTDRLLETASRDNKFKMWIEVIDIAELEAR
jgi:hypothetical protein